MTHLRAFAFLLPAALIAGASIPAVALESSSKQETYFAPDPAAPMLANDYLRAHSGDALQIVSVDVPGKETLQLFYAFGPVARSRQGVCRFTATRVFPHGSGDDKITWDSAPPNPKDYVPAPTPMAAVAPAPCPRQNDNAYITVEKDITDAELVEILGFWKLAATSEEKFDSASVYLSAILSPRMNQRFQAFRTATLKPSGEQPHLSGVFRSGLAAYDLGFADSASEPANFFVSVSKSAAGFHILNFQTQF